MLTTPLHSRSTPLSILVVEDEALFAAQLVATLERLGYQPLGPVADAEAALDLCQAGPWPDMVLLDIHIDGPLDGVGLARELLARRPLPLIFLTSQNDADTFIMAREVGPAAYLLKPVADDALQRAIELAAVNFASQANRSVPDAPDAPDEPAAVFAHEGAGLLLPDSLFVKEDGLLVKVRLADIQWVEADGKQCRLALAGRMVVVRQMLRDLARLLPASEFVQIQRSYLVNARFIERLDPVRNLVQVADQLLPLSLTYRDELLRRLKLA